MGKQMKRCTMTFECDLKEFPANPFNTETPFGKPFMIANGDMEIYQTALDALEALHSECAKLPAEELSEEFHQALADAETVLCETGQ